MVVHNLALVVPFSIFADNLTSTMRQSQVFRFSHLTVTIRRLDEPGRPPGRYDTLEHVYTAVVRYYACTGGSGSVAEAGTGRSAAPCPSRVRWARAAMGASYS
jgi:hypothetical protein